MFDKCIEAHKVHAHYGLSHILRGVDLKISKGETVALMGRNGMGKTTLIKCIMKLALCSSGSIKIFGDDISSLDVFNIARKGVAYVPEGRGIFPNLTVRENLLMAHRAGRSGRNDWTFNRVLENFPRLEQRLGHGGQQLSGGEQQMLSIGRALLTNPDILILDEATEGLAPLIAQDVWRIIKLVQKTGIASIIIDKNFKSLSAFVDRVAVMVNGRMVFDGSPRELGGRPNDRRNWLGV